MYSHTIIVFYSQIDKQKYILEYDSKYKETIRQYFSNIKVDISLHTLMDKDPTINNIVKNNPYFTNAKKLTNLEELIRKIEEIIEKNVPSVFDNILKSIQN